MKSARSGMTLFELLVVMTIVGIVYSIGIFSFQKEKLPASRISLDELKTSMSALEHAGKLRMICNSDCDECRIYGENTHPLSTVHLQHNSPIQRYGFNRQGELYELSHPIIRHEDTAEEGCFEFTLYPEGSSSFLLLKSGQTFYLYTPLGGDRPYVSVNEEEIRNTLFDESLYPLKNDDYHAL